MTAHRFARSRRFFECIYRLLLYGYPAEYRRVYGPLMLQAFRDLSRNTAIQNSLLASIAMWLRILADVVKTIPIEHIDALKKTRKPLMSIRSMRTLMLVLGFAAITGYLDVHATEVIVSLTCILLFSFIAGMLQPKGAWRWAILIGLSIPVSYFITFALGQRAVDAPRYPITLVVLVIPALIATYFGVLVNRITHLSQPPQID